MSLKVKVISQQPPGGRCTLYAGYADVLARHFGTGAEVVFSEMRNAHGDGFPSLLLNGIAVQPEDGVILMPADITASLAAQGIPGEAMRGLAEALDAPLERMMEQAQKPEA
jgi:cystathionine gamma-synthase